MDNKIRNFCIIAHIDHGKSTLADRFLELTGTVSKREMKDQMLDQMDLERERGITIKLQPVRMQYAGFELNLIDTPGHVDFSYEVSRSLAAVEGAILLVDATQGIEAQTLANLYLALDLDRTIIPVINKIDLPNANVPLVKSDLVKLLGCEESDILEVSAKTGVGVDAILRAVIDRVPAPLGASESALTMLIFDSFFDDYRGVIAYGRITSGMLTKGDQLILMASHVQAECLEVGMFKPKLVPTEALQAGEIGYVVTGLKNVQDCRVGDTITLLKNPAIDPLPGYKHLKPMVFAGIYCKEGDDYAELREAIGKMSLNDASLSFEPDHSEALGFGFRCGFLGILHLEIFQERISREYNIEIIVTAPSVGYRILLSQAGIHAWQRKEKSFDKKEVMITSPMQLPEVSHIDQVQEPWMKVDIVTPSKVMGNVMSLIKQKRGIFLGTDYIDEHKIVLRTELPLTSILVDFYDKLKSASSGYASLNYDFLEYRTCDVSKLNILVAGDEIEALTTIVYRDEAYRVGRLIVEKLKDTLHRQMFEVKIQAALGGQIIASSRIPAMRKDVTAKLYGGDVTRKRKLLEKQKKGKQRMRAVGKVDIPQDAFLAVLTR